MTLLFQGFHFHRTSLSRFFTLFPFRPQTILTTYRSPVKYTTYWHRPHTSTNKLPVIFIHGIGIGLYPYTNFLDEINLTDGLEASNSNDQIGILAIEIMPVSFRITHSALSRAGMCSEIEKILETHFGSDQKIVLVSHSYGTVIATHLLKIPSIAKRIGPVVLVDPVSILLHLPDVAYNFTRRLPKEANQHQLYYFASMDMGVSHTLSRHFFWNENVLWKSDFGGRNVTVSLSGRDLIVDTEAVGKYLGKDSELNSGEGDMPLINIDDDNDPGATTYSDQTPEDNIEGSEEGWKSRPWLGAGIDILWFSSLDHAQVFDKRATRRRLINAIRAYTEQA
jgi:pimeloyl-ACP methyl ester carboxylesterase